MAKDENKKVKKENKNEFKNLKAELKKVVWPTPKQLANNTIAVITIVLLTAVIVFALDFTFEAINEHGIEKLKSSLGTANETNEADESNEENTIVDNNGNIEQDNTDSETEENVNSENQTTEQESSENQETEQNADNANVEEQDENNQVEE